MTSLMRLRSRHWPTTNGSRHELALAYGGLLGRGGIEAEAAAKLIEDAARIARDVLAIMPDSEICLKRLIEYETLGGNSHRAEHYRRQLDEISADSRD